MPSRAFLSGFSTSIEMLLVLRCFVFIGVCVEFVAAVAWLAELFPEPKRREKVLGYTQAFSSLGGLLVATANGLLRRRTPRACRRSTRSASTIAESARAVALHADVGRDPGDPADPDPAVPAGVAGLAAEEARPARCKRPSIAALFSPELRRTTIVTTIMFAMAYGAAFGAIQQMPQIVPGLPEVRQMTAGLPPPRGAAHRAGGRRRTSPRCRRSAGSSGRVALAVPRGRHRQPPQADPAVPDSRADRDAARPSPGRRRPASSWLYPGSSSPASSRSAQFSFWGNYLPRVYPAAPARHRRELRRQHRRPADRHVVRVADRDAGRHPRPRVRADQGGAGRRGGRVLASIWSGSSPASGCPSRRLNAVELDARQSRRFIVAIAAVAASMRRRGRRRRPASHDRRSAGEAVQVGVLVGGRRAVGRPT